jgi:serine/threonine protein kinase
MIRVGDRIGPYTLVRKLGRGTFGVVWLAEKRTALAATKVALKLPNDDDIDLEAIKREAAVWVEASGHPNVLPIIDADIYDEQVVIVSEYAPDGSLADWLKEHGGKALTLATAVEITLGILDGLAHLHARRIIHRDLKPANILLQGKTPRLVDFGLARVLKTTGQSSNVSGTYAYMPPEAFDGKRSEQTDVWSAGVILYQMLTGSLPYPQTDDAALIGALLTREPEPPPDDLPEALREVLKYSLQKNPAERYQSVVEIREALRGVLHTHTSRPTAPQDASESEFPTRKFSAPSVELIVVAPPLTAPSPTIKATEPKPPVARESQPGALPTQKAIFPVSHVEQEPTLPSTSEEAKRRSKLWFVVAAFVVIIGLVVGASVLFSRLKNNSTATAILRTGDGTFLWVNDEAISLGPASPTGQIFMWGWDDSGTDAALANNRERVQKFLEMKHDWETKGVSRRVSEVNLNDLRDIRVQLTGDDAQIEIQLGGEDFGNRLKFALDELDRQRNSPIGPYILHINVAQGIEKGNHVTIGVSPDAPKLGVTGNDAAGPDVESKVTPRETAKPAAESRKAKEKATPRDEEPTRKKEQAKKEKDKKEKAPPATKSESRPRRVG